MYQVPDHPIIRNLELTGYPDGQEHPLPFCPKCGEEAMWYYRNLENEIVGCDNCINVCDAYDVANGDDDEELE